MAEKLETEDEGPGSLYTGTDGEMLGERHPLYEAYLRRLIEEGDRAIERGDFVVAETREELRRLIRG